MLTVLPRLYLLWRLLAQLPENVGGIPNPNPNPNSNPNPNPNPNQLPDYVGVILLCTTFFLFAYCGYALLVS